jgi:hypothetical protein
MSDFKSIFQFTLSSQLLTLVVVLLIVAIGLIIASFIAKKVGSLISKSKFIQNKISEDKKEQSQIFFNILVKAIYYLIVIFIIIAAAEKLGLGKFTEPLTGFLNSIFLYMPNILGGVFLLIITLIFAKLGKFFTIKVFDKIELDKKLKVQEKTSVTKILGDIVYLIIFLIFLPGVLSALKLDGILEPITNMLSKLLEQLPNILAAGIFLIIGWFIAYKIRDILEGILISLNLNERLKIDDKSVFEGNLGKIIANIVYVLILIPVISASLSYIGLQYITEPIVMMISVIFSYLPRIAGVVIILVVATFFAKLIEGIISNLLKGVHFDSHLEKTGLKAKDDYYSHLVGKAIKITIIYLAIIQSIDILELTILKNLSGNLTVLLGKILLGILIIMIGVYISNFVSEIIKKSELKSKDCLATLSKTIIIIFVGAMGLRQMGIANEIINMAFGFTIGAIAIGFAIAFGIGGRDMAARKLDELDKKWKEKND